MNGLSAWWQQLAPRERLALATGGSVLVLVLAWLVVFDPLASRTESAARRLLAEQETLAWLRGLSVPAAASTVQPLSEGETALDILNEEIRAAGLESALKRLTPTGEGRFELGFEGAGWAPLTRCLVGLVETRGARLTRVHAERNSTPGQVNASLTLEFSAQQGGGT